MSKFYIEITEQGNDALTGVNPRMAYSSILLDIANKIVHGYNDGPVMDTNGNKVGDWDIGDIEE